MDNEHKVLNYRGLGYFLDKLKSFFIIKPKIGSPGQVLTLLELDNIKWEDPQQYELLPATDTTLGGVKSSITGTTSDRYYNVEVNTDGTMKVNVPWSAGIEDVSDSKYYVRTNNAWAQGVLYDEYNKSLRYPRYLKIVVSQNRLDPRITKSPFYVKLFTIDLENNQLDKSITIDFTINGQLWDDHCFKGDYRFFVNHKNNHSNIVFPKLYCFSFYRETNVDFTNYNSIVYVINTDSSGKKTIDIYIKYESKSIYGGIEINSLNVNNNGCNLYYYTDVKLQQFNDELPVEIDYDLNDILRLSNVFDPYYKYVSIGGIEDRDTFYTKLKTLIDS